MDARLKGRRLLAVLLSLAAAPAVAQMSGKEYDAAAAEQAARYLEEGRETFRFDTFGSEDFWGGRLKLHERSPARRSAARGPASARRQALELGLKVDVDAIPADVAEALGRARSISRTRPARSSS